MGDYAYLMQELAGALDVPRAPFPRPSTPVLPHNGKPMDVLTPARYPPTSMTEAQRAENVEALRQTHQAAVAGLTGTRFVARAVFRSLLGSWELRRAIRSRLPSHPSGEFRGTARFLLREGTRDGRPTESAAGRKGVTAASGEAPEDPSGQGNGAAEPNREEDLGQEYLYIEEGSFTADSGLTFSAHRRYVWRYDETLDSLSVWFVRTDDKMRTDYRFHDIEFLPPLLSPPVPRPASETPPPPAAGPSTAPTAEERGPGWLAKAGHLCEADYYDVRYEFRFRAVNLDEWSCGYVVRGPQKDYTIEGVYRRAGVL